MNDSCDCNDCHIYVSDNRKTVYGCNCSLCFNSNQTTSSSSTSKESNSSKKNDNKKFFRDLKIFIYVIIGLIFVLIILCIISCYHRRKNVNNNVRSNPTNNNINVDPTIYKINEKMINDIFNNELFLGAKKCKKEYEENHHQCTICLEGFKIDIDDVCLTPCNHLFHHKCIFDYLIQKHNAKCPNCNNNFIEYYKNNK